MSSLAARFASLAAGLSLGLALAGCAAWREEAPATALTVPAPIVTPLAAAPPQPVERAPLPVSNGPEDYLCLDGSRIRIGYTRDVATVTLNGASPISMRRADEAGLTAYRTESSVLFRSGPRVALTIDAASVVVRSGDTLGVIASRIYGDRLRAMDIAHANADQIADPNLIYPGQVLRLPQVEHRCRRTLRQQASDAPVTQGALQRRVFTPPSGRQPELQRVLATATDRR